MARGKAISDEVRAKVIAEILTGEGVSEISRRMKLPKQTVSRIKNEIAPEKLGQVGTEKAERMDNLICDYLEINFKALGDIAKHASDANYIKEQSADKLATLYEQLAATAFRLIEAEGVEESEGAE